MHILVNGDKVKVATQLLTHVLESLGYQCNEIVVAVNQEFVARESWPNFQIQDGDELDVLSPIEGG